ncbi:helix-turn-helix transcriptional regulator [Paenibacillus sp. strain BS8-2]
MERWTSGGPVGRFGATAAFLELMYVLLGQSQPDESIGTLEAVRRTKQYMDEHYGEPITAEELSASAHINPKYYITLFGELYGQSPIKYLN